MQPSKRSSSKEDVTQEVSAKITSQHFLFLQVHYLRLPHGSPADFN
jgi:hypothetical protein